MVINVTLSEDREFPSFTDDDISPLYNNDTDEEGGVTGVLQDLSVGVRLGTRGVR